MSFKTFSKALLVSAIALGATGSSLGANLMFGSDMSVGPIPSYFPSWYAGCCGTTTIFTAQNGLFYGFSTPDWFYSYASPGSLAYANVYGVQEQTFGNPAGYLGMAMTAPGTNSTAATIKGANLSDGATRMLINTGDWAGNATTFTVVMANGQGVRAPFTDPNTDATATAICSADITLAQRQGQFNYPNGSVTGTNTYSVPFKSFKCSKGSVAKLLPSVTVVAVEVVNAKNNNFAGISYPVISYVAFN